MKYLQDLLERSTSDYPNNTALIQPDVGTVTYRELNHSAGRISDGLRHRGIQRGHRVGVYCSKSIDMVASLFGIMKSGAAYVPVDPGSPVSRNAYIFKDCQVQMILSEKKFLESLLSQFQSQKPDSVQEINNNLFLIEGPGKLAETEGSGVRISPGELAYILYTSGSTGLPKGVCYPHEGALAFVDWCSEVFQPDSQDIFSSHAPFHFDLSIFDIYVCCKHGATLVLIGEELGKQPSQLADLISDQKMSIWYSTPSILNLLTQFGKLERHSYPNLRLVLFAGEVFPIKHLKNLKEIWRHPRFFNLYGPTETNVCTYYEIPPQIPSNQNNPFPIGKSCSHLICKVFGENGEEIQSGIEGELCVTGPIMAGYWNLPERTSTAFLTDSNGNRFYKTGDIVRRNDDGDFIYVGRRDRMVKKRGYRVELGEIESVLLKHPAVTEAAVVALQDQDGQVLIKAFLNVVKSEETSIIKMKQFSMDNLPSYMVPDRFAFLSSLPKTSTDKIDYQSLKTL
jgi:L-proline---[L-prolyl-carrier protein] ligase